jgi:hypothetical protein
MSDQQRGEELDESLTGDVPPDEPTAVEDTGVTGVEQLGGESFEERDRRTEPEVDEQAGAFGEGTGQPEMVAEQGAEPTDADTEVTIPVDEAGAFGEGPGGAGEDVGPLSDEDEVSGDETTRDVATERTAPAAEEAAVHLEEG